ncbi:hypothetical protein [Fibrella arboris]|uniref:hypothetical protein n=1 Tax=Fibrella arboris TaxID=3242486 RepID=UPI003520327B
MRNKPYNSPDYWQPFTKLADTSQWVAGLDTQLTQATDRTDVPLATQGTLQVCLTANSFWLLHQAMPSGWLAIRTCFDPQTLQGYKVRKQKGAGIEYEIQGSLGTFRVSLALANNNPSLLHYTTWLKPAQSFTIQALPRDLYVLDETFSPATTEGMVYVTQNGPTSGLVYLSVVKPMAGSLLYFQNFTALNDYCQLTKTEPSDTVSTQWPEIGFALPTSEQPLPAGQEICLSDAFICLIDSVPQSEFEASDQFLAAMASIYTQLPKTDTAYYNWPKAAERTIEALTESPNCGRIIQRQYYLNAYVDAMNKPPESMVQLAILVPLWEYQEWLGKPVPLADSLKQNIPTFYDARQEVIMRWLPAGTFTEDNRSEEQDPNKIDSWYLLHTLMNLGRLAEMGNLEAKDLLFNSLEFVIRAAHHFGYNWPVFYDIHTLEVIKAETAEGKGGELDVAGLYTHVMLQAYELTKDPRYLDEATTSAERLRGKGFELLYQTNITIMSSLTLAKLWKLTGNRLYFDLSRLSIANVIARMWVWECNFGFGQSISTFMGVAPLKNAPYLAAYEEAEIMATMLSYLKEVGQDVPDPVRLFYSEYMKYLLHRGRYYYPAELPVDMVCQEPREGRIIRALPIPLEDISTGWKQAGAVGQEVYGGALAYIMTTYAYKRFEQVPVIIFSDYPIYHADYQGEDKNAGYVVIRLAGTADYQCRVRLLAKGRELPQVQLIDEDDADNQPIKPLEETKQYQDYRVQGNKRLRVEWSRPRQA